MRVWIALLLIATAGLGCWAKSSTASESPTGRKLWLVKRACEKHMKTRRACSCVTKNISVKIDREQFDQEQLDDVVLVMKHLYVMGEIFQPRLESMADYLTGLEYHCQKNPKYSVN